MRIIKSEEFKIIPWKNGLGSTREMIKISDPADHGSFLFRLSQAPITQDGPFSQFPGIDRKLFLLKGNGIELSFEHQNIKLQKIYSQFDFFGENEIFCNLIDGVCEDFNIMFKRGWKSVEASVKSFISSNSFSLKLLDSYIYVTEGCFQIQGQKIFADTLLHVKDEIIIVEGLITGKFIQIDLS